MKRLRDVLVCVWPFLASAAVAAVIVAATVAIWSIFDQRSAEEEARRAAVGLAADVRNIARDAKRAAETNTAILQATRPCVEADPATPPEHPSCVEEVRSRAVVDKALADIANEAHNQHQHLVNVVAQLVGKRAPILPRTAPRPAPPKPASAPREGAPPSPPAVSPSTTTTTTAPPAASVCVKVKPEKCK